MAVYKVKFIPSKKTEKHRWSGSLSSAWRLIVVPRGQQRAQPARLLRRPQLPQRLRFDLPYPLAGHVELLSDLLERVLPFAPNAEPQLNHLFLFGRKRLQNTRSFIANVRIDPLSNDPDEQDVRERRQSGIATSGLCLPAK